MQWHQRMSVTRYKHSKSHLNILWMCLQSIRIITICILFSYLTRLNFRQINFVTIFSPHNQLNHTIKHTFYLSVITWTVFDTLLLTKNHRLFFQSLCRLLCFNGRRSQLFCCFFYCQISLGFPYPLVPKMILWSTPVFILRICALSCWTINFYFFYFVCKIARCKYKLIPLSV